MVKYCENELKGKGSFSRTNQPLRCMLLWALHARPKSHVLILFGRQGGWGPSSPLGENIPLGGGEKRQRRLSSWTLLVEAL